MKNFQLGSKLSAPDELWEAQAKALAHFKKKDSPEKAAIITVNGGKRIVANQQ